MNSPRSCRKLVSILLIVALAAPISKAADSVPLSPPVSTAVPSDSSAPAKPKNSATAPEAGKRLGPIDPGINYSVWLYVAPAVVIFAVLIYNEWDQRRKRKPSAPTKGNPGRH